MSTHSPWCPHVHLGVHSATLHRIQKFRSEILSEMKLEEPRRRNSCHPVSGTPGHQENRKSGHKKTKTVAHRDTRKQGQSLGNQHNRTTGHQDTRKQEHQDSRRTPWRFLSGPWTPSHRNHSGRTKLKLMGKSQYRRPCHTTPCYTTPYHTMSCHTMQCHTISCYTMLCHKMS